MKKVLFICFISLLNLGCASTKYGYSLEEWNSLTQQERDEIKTSAGINVKNMRAKQREKEFVNQSVNVLFGTRSNTY